MADAESALVGELRAIAGLSEGDAFDVDHDGLAIRVIYTGGSSSNLLLRVAYDAVAKANATAYRSAAPLRAIRPMRVALVPESDDHRDAKADGLDVEHQTGDAAFDAAVYVDTPTPDAILRVVLGDATRAAALALFALGASHIVVDDDDGYVTARKTSFASRHPDPVGDGRRLVDAFASLVRGLPVVHRTEGEHPVHPLQAPGTVLLVLAILGVVVAPPLYFGVVVADRCVDGKGIDVAGPCMGPGIVGLVVGAVVAVVVGMVTSLGLARRYAGKSSDASGKIHRLVGALALLVATVAGSLVAFAVARR